MEKGKAPQTSLRQEETHRTCTRVGVSTLSKERGGHVEERRYRRSSGARCYVGFPPSLLLHASLLLSLPLPLLLPQHTHTHTHTHTIRPAPPSDAALHCCMRRSPSFSVGVKRALVERDQTRKGHSTLALLRTSPHSGPIPFTQAHQQRQRLQLSWRSNSKFTGNCSPLPPPLSSLLRTWKSERSSVEKLNAHPYILRERDTHTHTHTRAEVSNNTLCGRCCERMSLQFTVSGPNIRVLLSVLTCVSRLGEAVYVVGLSDGIEISAVSPGRNGYMAVRVHARCFDRFLLEPPSHRSTVDHGSGLVAPDAAAGGNADVSSVDTPNPSLCLLTKTLVATVLRQHNNVQSLDFQYRTAASSGSAAAAMAESDADKDSSDADHDLWKGRADADVVRWHCTYARNLTKTFLLRLAEGEPTSVYADLSRYRFEVCGDARTYGSLLASLPSSANQCALTLPESGGLELRSVRQAGSSSSSSAAAASSRESGSAAAPSGSTRAADGSSTVVTAFESTFTLFRFFEPTASPPVASTGAAATELEVGPSEVSPTPFSITPQQQQQQRPQRNFAVSVPDHPPWATATVNFVSLPSKTFDVKPFKNAAWLAEQLGVQLHLLTGEEGVPLIIASITPEEVRQWRESLSCTGSAAGRPLLVTSNSPPTSAPTFISFILYVAALDSTPSAGRASGSGGAPVGVADTSIVTAISSAASSPRTSMHHRTSKGGGAAQAAVAATPTPGYGEEENGEHDGMLVSSGTLSHVEASLASTNTAARGGGMVGRLSRESNSTVNSAYVTPRPTASPSELVMVMTGGDTPSTRSADTGGGDAAHKALGLPRGVTASSLPGCSTVTMPGATAHSAAQPISSSHTTTFTALNTMYPLDFDAFVRTYTSMNEADGDTEEEDAQDAELREFLASCVASMS